MNVRTTIRHSFLSRERQFLPRDDSRSLCANTRIRLLATHSLFKLPFVVMHRFELPVVAMTNWFCGLVLTKLIFALAGVENKKFFTCPLENPTQFLDPDHLALRRRHNFSSNVSYMTSNERNRKLK